MNPPSLARGAVRLVGQAVEQGALAIQKVHLATAARAFDVLEAVPVVAPPARVVREVYEVATKTSYGAVALGARALTTVAVAAIDLAAAPAATPKS